MKVTVTVSFIWVAIFSYVATYAQSGSKLGVTTIVKNTGKRLALVIGNKDYRNGISPLTNTERDVDSVTAVLKKLGFEVSPYKNLDFTHTQEAIKQFADKLANGKVEVALVYFSGHGLGVGDINYLLPIDTQISCVDQLKSYESVSLNRVVDTVLSKGIKNNFFFLDACRNIGSLRRCDGTLVGNDFRGLAKPMEKYRNSMIAFATREGDVADDNTYDKINSLFTSELIKYLPTPNVGIRSILDLTKKGVLLRSNDRQDPKRWDDLIDDYVFIRTTALPSPASLKSITVVAYKPNNSTVLDVGLAKKAAAELKQKLPDYDIQLQTNSKGLLNEDIICTVTCITSTSNNSIEVNNSSFDLIKADTQLLLKFTRGKDILDEIELSEGGTDHQKNIAIENSIERALNKLKDIPINFPNQRTQLPASNPSKR